MSYSDNWDNKRVITGWALAAGVTVAITAAVLTGASLADHQATVRSINDNAALIECAKTPKTATECRVLIYGAR